MATNAQLIRRLATGATLLESEIQQLERAFDDLDQAKTYIASIQNGTGVLKVAGIESGWGQFRISPINAWSGYYDDLSTSIPNNTETVLGTWSNTYGENLRRFSIDGNKIRIVNAPSKGVIGVFASAIWAQNGTGRRALSLKAYDASDAFVGGVTIYSYKPSNVEVDVYPGITWMLPDETTAYYQFNAYQNSGGALDVEYYELALFEMV